jgi:hypothetical protein
MTPTFYFFLKYHCYKNEAEKSVEGQCGRFKFVFSSVDDTHVLSTCLMHAMRARTT